MSDQMAGATRGDSYPKQHARTRGFSLGLPQRFSVSSDGSRVTFLRSRAADDPLAGLWQLEVATGEERLVFDPLEAGGEGSITPEERDRRERAGERLTGVTTYATDRDGRVAAFSLGDRLFVADLLGVGVQELHPAGPAFDARPSPDGLRVAYETGGTLRAIDLETGADVELVADPDPKVTWGLAEFVAAEEMDRLRGYWWAPDSTRLAVARVDERPVTSWHIASPADPEEPPRSVAYPKAGTPNADVSLHVVDVEGREVGVRWDRATFPYLVAVDWSGHHPLTLHVQTRDQRRWQVLTADPATGETTVVAEQTSSKWMFIVPGIPAWTDDGGLVFQVESEDTRRLAIDGEAITPPGLHVVQVLEVGSDVTFCATEDPTELHVFRAARDGSLTRLSGEPGVYGAAVGGHTTVLVRSTLETSLPVAEVVTGRAPGTDATEGSADARMQVVTSHAEVPSLRATPTLFPAGERRLRTMVFTPGGVEPDRPLPVLVSPYGGPGHNMVMKAGRMQLEAQWFADQGFVVITADGRGTMCRGLAWEHAIDFDVAGPVLDDQIDALHACADRFGFLDLSAVAIRGWSFGGYLTLLALLRAPEVFHAGISGAPVTDWTLYDTHYTERYVGTPQERPEVYERTSLLKDAATLTRPLLLIHGFADDNVFVANSLRFSKALLEAGRPHSMLPLTGITHRPTDPAAAENMLLLEVRFLRQALGLNES
jgi:dipeptidyl-peptidase-4